MVPAFMRVLIRLALVLAAAAVVLGNKEDKDGRYGTDCTTVRMVVTNNAKYAHGTDLRFAHNNSLHCSSATDSFFNILPSQI